MKKLLTLVFMAIVNTAFGNQLDSSKNSILNNLNFSVSGTHITQFDMAGETGQKVDIPKYFIENNKPGWIEVRGIKSDGNTYLAKLTDNPLPHGATFFDFKLGYQSQGFSVNLNLVAEHRGISYGVYSTKAMIFYPKYSISYDSSFTFFDKKFSAGAFAGNYTNLKLYEGLVIDNIDAQGMQTYLKWDQCKFGLNAIGDLSNEIGLNIDAALNLMMTIEDIKLKDNINLETTFGGFNFISAYKNSSEFDGKNNFGYNVSVAVKNHSNYDNKIAKSNSLETFFKGYIEFSNRNSETSNDFQSSSAFLAGISTQFLTQDLDIDLTAEYRFYGSAFNNGFYDSKVSYRKMIEFSDTLGVAHKFPEYDYNNTIGDNLYPLSFYDRPFSQWASYTIYENLDVSNFIFKTKINYKLISNLFTDADIDFNYITAGKEPGFLYPFYTLGIGIGALKENYIMISISNKSMNLDMNYPTFYMNDTPVIMLKLHFKAG